MCMEVLFGVNRLYIKQLVHERDSTNRRTVEFTRVRILSFFFLSLSFFYYNYLIINYL